MPDKRETYALKRIVSLLSGMTSEATRCIVAPPSLSRIPMLKLAIAGAAGRMGRQLIRAAGRADGVTVTTAIERADHPALGDDAGVAAGVGEIGVALKADIDGGDGGDGDGGDFDLMLDFTAPAATQQHLSACRRLGRGMLIGTTGLNAEFDAVLRAAAADIPLIQAANTSVGVNLCLALVEAAATALGRAFDVEIVEAHHRHKVDAPSGTALALGQAAADALGVDLDDAGVFTRHGHTGARRPGDIGFASVRGGDLAGEHTALFVGDGERVEITHRATNRRIFAAGAIKAAKWLAGKPPGLYSMREVLGLDA